MKANRLCWYKREFDLEVMNNNIAIISVLYQ
jgi:hypothetical protein